MQRSHELDDILFSEGWCDTSNCVFAKEQFLFNTSKYTQCSEPDMVAQWRGAGAKFLCRRDTEDSTPIYEGVCEKCERRIENDEEGT